MSKYKKKYKKYKLSGKCKDSRLKQMKANIQKEQRTAYWQYIKQMICNIPVDDDKTPTSSKFPKQSISYIKSQKSESSNIATLRQNCQLHFDTKTKANILNEQFQKTFTPATDDAVPNKGQSQHPQMPDIIIAENGINKGTTI